MLIRLSALALLLLSSTAQAGDVYQISTISALLAGSYAGEATMSEVMTHGDFGLGTLEALDGELVVLDGRAWQGRSDGVLAEVAGQTRTPFAVVTAFHGNRPDAVAPGLSFTALLAKLDDGPPPGRILAARIDGRFAKLTIRSVPRQNPLYRPLAEVVKEQQVTFNHENIDGTLVGFRFPPTVGGVNVPGWHVHFISADRRIGGHVLALETGSAMARIDEIDTLTVTFPATLPAATQPGRASYGEQLKTVEGGRR